MSQNVPPAKTIFQRVLVTNFWNEIYAEMPQHMPTPHSGPEVQEPATPQRDVPPGTRAAFLCGHVSRTEPTRTSEK